MFGKTKCKKCGVLFTKRATAHSYCVECWKIIGSNASETAVQNRANELIRGKVHELLRERIDAPHPSEVSEAIFKEFGGIAGVAKLYHEQVQAAITRDPGSKAVLEALKTVAVQMPESSARNRATAPDVGLDDMSDGELRQVVLENMTTEELELIVAKRKGLVIEMQAEPVSRETNDDAESA